MSAVEASEMRFGATVLQAALSLAEEHGMPVFPCRCHDEVFNGRTYKAKSPLTRNGFKDATRNLGQIEAWWLEYPDALIGVPTGIKSKLFVIDVDPRGAEWYATNVARLSAGRIHSTLRGHHLIYRDVGLGCTTGTLSDGVDTRGEGGYVIWWPASGQVAVGDLNDITEPPTWVVDALKSAKSRKSGLTSSGGGIEGDRSRDLLGRVARDFRAGLPDYEILTKHRAHPHVLDQTDPDRAVQRCIDVVRASHGPVEVQAIVSKSDDETEAAAAGQSDDELALKFSARYGSNVRYVAAWGRWLIWDGQRFANDDCLRVIDMVRELCRDVLAEHMQDPNLSETQRKSLRNRLGGGATIWSVAKLVGADPRHAVSTDQLDADPWALNTPAGIIDLKTGARRNHDPTELHTKITAAAPGGECPLFTATLERAQPDPAVREYLQRLAGYAMTGSAREHSLTFAVGGGRNLKGTIFHAIRRALGDYGLEVSSELLMESNHDRHPTEMAVLRGARLVVMSEIDSGRRWNESRLKGLTGGDPISARYIGKDLFEFEPTHTLVIIGNVKPGLRQVDEAIRSRLHLVEFNVTIPLSERDTEMPERLKAEYGGILNWMIAGCVDWLDIGLRAPASVSSATADYLAVEDMLSAWLKECTADGGQITLAAAHRSYREWCQTNGAIVLGRNSFADQLNARGYTRGSDRNKAVVFGGLTLSIPPDRFSDDR